MSKIWRSEEEMLALAQRELFTAVVGDIMDKLGYQQQFLPPQIRPLSPEMVVVGRAMPVLEADLTSSGNPAAGFPEAKAFGVMLEALDDLKPGEVYLCAGASPSYALWGELMSTRAMKLGSAGAVLDGYCRDTRGILRLRFPTFSYGSYAQDQSPRGKVVDFRVPVSIGSVRIHPGDLVFGDIDGVCVVPVEIEEETLIVALEKVRGENLVRQHLEEGMSAAEAFERFGIL